MATAAIDSVLSVSDLAPGVPFGARIKGVTFENLQDQAVRDEIMRVFRERGVIVFDGVEQSDKMQLELSGVFGPLKEHPVKTVERADGEQMPGVIVIRSDPNGSIVEVEGKKLSSWQPWHFDHCYNDELNYAGVLRCVVKPSEMGRTGFADGIQIYNDLPADIRARIEGKDIIYTLDLIYSHMRYANRDFDVVQDGSLAILEIAKTMPRAIHPAVWTRDTGEKVMHMAPWMAFGIVGDETPEGDQLFEDVWAAMLKVMKPYFHVWQGDEMVVWDNARVLHRGMGAPAGEERVMHRTTIKGDYGHGRWEKTGSVGFAGDVM